MFSAADWVAIVTLMAGVAGSVAAGYWQSRKPAMPAGEEERELTFAKSDRQLLEELRAGLREISLDDRDRRILYEIRDVLISLRDVSLSLGRRIDASTDEQVEVRRATQDLTGALTRLTRRIGPPTPAEPPGTAETKSN